MLVTIHVYAADSSGVTRALQDNGMSITVVAKRHGRYANWEPIYIGTHRDPYYDERLSWEGMKDKMPQAYILCVKNYNFMVVSDAFLVHKPGIKGKPKDVQRQIIVGRQNRYVNSVVMPEMYILFGKRKFCKL